MLHTYRFLASNTSSASMSNLSTGRHLMRHLDFLRVQKLCKIVMCAEKTRLLKPANSVYIAALSSPVQLRVETWQE